MFHSDHQKSGEIDGIEHHRLFRRLLNPRLVIRPSPFRELPPAWATAIDADGVRARPTDESLRSWGIVEMAVPSRS
jgi:hypothetical protein